MKKQSRQQLKKRMRQSTAVRILGVLSIVSLILVFVMLIWNKVSSNHYDLVIEQQKTLIANAEKFQDASAFLTQEVRSFAANMHQEHYDNYWKEVNTDQNREKSLISMREIGLTDEEETIIGKISSISNELIPLEEQAMKLTKDGKFGDAVALLYGEKYNENISKIKTLTMTFKDLIETRMQSKLNDLGNIIDKSFNASFLCLFLVVIVQISIIVYVSRRLLAPVLSIKENMVLMAEGDLDTELEVETDGTEIGQLVKAVKDTKIRTKQIIEDIAHVTKELADGDFTVTSRREESYIGAYLPILKSMNILKQKQSEILSQISVAADQVTCGSGQVSSGAQALAQGATEQAASIEELSGAIAEITKGIEDNSHQIISANNLVMETGEAVTSSSQKMAELLTAMQEINDRAREIANIIKTIDDIAFQTNILALNAAVEAARAGNAGKGFAVVADEVRNLASKSSEAAKNTTNLIENTIASVENGTQIADATAKELQIVVDSSGEIISAIKEIETTSTQQAAVTKQIANGVEQISHVVQTNSATAEESAAASEELSSQAIMMKELVQKFKFADGQADIDDNEKLLQF